MATKKDNTKVGTDVVLTGSPGEVGAPVEELGTVDADHISDSIIPDNLSEIIKVRVLVSCEFGEPNDVVELARDLMETLGDQVDANVAAVAYAESLEK